MLRGNFPFIYEQSEGHPIWVPLFFLGLDFAVPNFWLGPLSRANRHRFRLTAFGVAKRNTAQPARAEAIDPISTPIFTASA